MYSDDKNDISNMDHEDFVEAYRTIIKESCKLLNDDSFACFVVSEVRSKDKAGSFYGFVGETISAFEAAGLKYYNEIILLNAVGSSAMRANRIFCAARKVVRVHQNILVFVKGDPKKATEKIGIVEVMEIGEVGNE